MSADRPGEMRIGQVLEGARERAGLEIADAEEQTKIRAKYLRALEAEDWDELPSGAYAKGFLRTYGQLLGLDADALVDEYRRQVESEMAEPSYPLGDQVLERRRRPGGTAAKRSRAPLLIALAVIVIAAAVVAFFVLGDDDEKGTGKPDGKGHRAGQRHHGGGGKGKGDGAKGTVKLEMRVRDPVEVCLLGGGGEALIDGQVLPAGDREAFERKQFELRFPSGFAGDQLTIKIAGKKRLLPKANGPAAYEISAPQRVKPLGPPGKRCP